MTEHPRRFPDKAFSHSPQRSSPVITFHFAAMKCFGSACDLVQPRLRNLLTSFTGFKTLNKFPNQAGAILYWQQQNLLTQLFQCHHCAFRGDQSYVVMPHCGFATCATSMLPTREWEHSKPGIQRLSASTQIKELKYANAPRYVLNALRPSELEEHKLSKFCAKVSRSSFCYGIRDC